MNRVPVMAPRAPNADSALARLRQIDASGWYSNFGPQEAELRQRFATRLNVSADQIATVANATLGLAGAVSVLGGDRWLVPTYTFAATPAAVITAGAQVVLGDIDADSWVLDPGDADVDGYMPVAPFGAAPEVDLWAKRGRVVHDAAASIGERLDLSGLPPGQAVIFSLHATKVLGAGEGGLAVFGDESSASRFRSWTNFGFAGTRESAIVGINAKMSEIQCAYAHAALDGWTQERGEWVAARSLVAGLAEEVGLTLFAPSRAGVNPYAIAVFPDEDTAIRVESELDARSIDTRRWWSQGCHRMPAFAGMATTQFPRSDDAAGTSLGLPMFRGLDQEDYERIGAALRTIL